jgi:hypothetical protein
MRYLVRLANEFAFEEVPESIFAKRIFAVDDEGNPRYSNDHVIIFEGHICLMHLENVGTDTLGRIMRAIGVTIPTNSVPNGFIREPSHVKFREKGRRFLIEATTGQRYKAA